MIHGLGAIETGLAPREPHAVTFRTGFSRAEAIFDRSLFTVLMGAVSSGSTARHDAGEWTHGCGAAPARVTWSRKSRAIIAAFRAQSAEPPSAKPPHRSTRPRARHRDPLKPRRPKNSSTAGRRALSLIRTDPLEQATRLQPRRQPGRQLRRLPLSRWPGNTPIRIMKPQRRQPRLTQSTQHRPQRSQPILRRPRSLTG